MDWTTFFDIHAGLPREGPGDNASTRKAFAMVTGLPADPLILDLGCGPGMQTRELARLSGGRVIGLDLHLPFLRQLEASASSEGLSGRVLGLRASMSAPCFRGVPFDLIWAEGSIYVMGFDEGLETWRDLLKPGGHLVLTEAAWLKPDPPEEVRSFWNEAYPAIRNVEANLHAVREAGLEPAGHFVLPDSAWLEEYYRPLQERIGLLRKAYAGRPDALAMLDAEDRERELFRRYSAWYGYVFFVCRKPVRR